MSTRSRIGIVMDDGSVKSVYCHWDGYLSNNGQILLDCYKDKDRIEGLVNLGDLSSLEITPAKCIAYHRDRNEDFHQMVSKDINEFLTNIDYLMEEFVYLFKDNKWFYIESYDFYKSKKTASIEDFIELTQEKIEPINQE